MNFPLRPSPAILQLPNITVEAATARAMSFLEDGLPHCRDHKLELRLFVSSVAVFKSVSFDPVTGLEDTGWIVGGNIPHLALNDRELKTAAETLVIYGKSLTYWLKRKGVQDDEGNMAEYRVPPNWELMTYTDGYEEWQMGLHSTFILWILLHELEADILHPELRERCRKSGWILRDLETGRVSA